MIHPTVGRKVWYSPSVHDIGVKFGEQPMDATIVYVWNDRMVNLVVFDHSGSMLMRHSVQLLQDDDAPNPGGGHCYWMPYQKGQAALTEQYATAVKSVYEEAVRG